MPASVDTMAMRQVLVMALVFVVDGRVVVQGRVATLAVVEDLDEVEDRRPQPGRGWPGVAVEQLALQGGEEALGDGVVQRVADSALEATSSEAARRRPNANAVYWQP